MAALMAPGVTVKLVDLLPETLVVSRNGAMEPVSADTLKDTTVGLYFSAHWCPPCRQFTPRLLDSYRKLRDKGKKFEIVFVSLDQDIKGFETYFNLMPWLAVPYDQQQFRQSLPQKFGVEGIPTLVIIGPEGQVKNVNARAAVIADPLGNSFPWSGMDTPRTSPAIWMIAAVLIFWALYYMFFHGRIPQHWGNVSIMKAIHSKITGQPVRPDNQ